MSHQQQGEKPPNRVQFRLENAGVQHIESDADRTAFYKAMTALLEKKTLVLYCSWALPLSYPYVEHMKKLHRYSNYTYTPIETEDQLIEALAMTWKVPGHFLPMDPQRNPEFELSFKLHCPEEYAEFLATAGDWQTLDEADEAARNHVLELERERTELGVELERIEAADDADFQQRRLTNSTDYTVRRELTNRRHETEMRIEDIDAELVALEKRAADYAANPDEHRFWRLSLPFIECPVTPLELKEALRSFQQRTPLWHLMRRFFIGATNLKYVTKLHAPETPTRRQLSPNYISSITLGLTPSEKFDWYVSRALQHGSEFEDLARDGYMTVIQAKYPGRKLTVREFGMTPALYSPHFYAQSPDGLVVDETTGEAIGTIEIKCQYMRYSALPELQGKYMNQCLQCILSHWDDIPSKSLRWLDFIAMFYRRDTDAGYPVPLNDPDTVEFTVERIQPSPTILRAFVRTTVAYAFYLQLLIAEAKAVGTRYEAKAKLARLFIGMKHAEFCTAYHRAVAEIKRGFMTFTDDDDERNVREIVLQQAHLSMYKVFSNYDDDHYAKWFERRADISGEACRPPPRPVIPPQEGDYKRSIANEDEDAYEFHGPPRLSCSGEEVGEVAAVDGAMAATTAPPVRRKRPTDEEINQNPLIPLPVPVERPTTGRQSKLSTYFTAPYKRDVATSILIE